MNNRREQVGWYFYDWANSAFYTTVVTVFLGPYLTGIAKAAAESLDEGNTFVHPLGIRVFYGSFFPYVIALSVGLQMVFLPILGAIADSSHRKKQMLALFAYIGSFATVGLYFLQGTNYLLGGGLFVLANLSYGASIVFYNSFLPDIASAEDRDRVSSVGWAIGYLGGGLLLALNLYLFSKAESFGLTPGQAVRISLASSGAWWAVFTLIPLSTLKNRLPVKEPPAGQHFDQRSAALSSDAVVSYRVLALQRCNSSCDRASVGVRLGGVEAGTINTCAGDPDGAVRRVLWRAALQLGC